MKKLHLWTGRDGLSRSLRLAGWVALLVLMTGVTAWARVGGPCVNCHTMHNSQDGASVVGDTLPALLSTGCIGCHTSDAETIVDLNDGTRIPIVYTKAEPDPKPGSNNSMLAGGNFHWVANGDDSKGHNVFIGQRDAKLFQAPGASTSCTPCHDSLATAKSSCQGCHLPAHHADDSAKVVTAANGSYRFLGDVMMVYFATNGRYPPEISSLPFNGVSGIEDPDWEQKATSTQHNVYLGTTDVYDRALTVDKGTIGQMCAGCHGNFHHQMNSEQASLSGVWIRHPSDVLIPNSGEYAAYKTYSPLAPVAKPNLEPGMETSDLVEPGKDIVTCISCHRPHGSPYPDMLRWDYDTCDAGTANDECGCYVCHTAKD